MVLLSADGVASTRGYSLLSINKIHHGPVPQQLQILGFDLVAPSEQYSCILLCQFIQGLTQVEMLVSAVMPIISMYCLSHADHQHPRDTHLSVEELCDMVRHGEVFSNKVHHYATSLCGTKSSVVCNNKVVWCPWWTSLAISFAHFQWPAHFPRSSRVKRGLSLRILLLMTFFSRREPHTKQKKKSGSLHVL